MPLNFKELKRELGESLSNRADLTSRLGSFLNIAQDRIARKYKFSEMTDNKILFIGSSGATDEDREMDRKVTLPEQVRDIMSLMLIDGSASRKLEFIPSREWDNAVSIEKQFITGRPQSYTVFKNEIILYRIPDKEYKIELRYSKWPKKLVKDDQYSDFDHKDDLLVTAAQLWALQSLGEIERANHVYAIYKTLVEEVVGYDQTKADQVIRPSSGSRVNSDKTTDPFYFGNNRR